MNEGGKRLKPIDRHFIRMGSHRTRKPRVTVTKEEPVFLDYDLRLKFDSLCDKLKFAEEPLHLLSSLIELFKHDCHIMCRIMDSSKSFTDAFDNPVCFDERNIDQTMSLFALILTDTDRVAYGFSNAVHHMVPLLRSEKYHLVAVDVIVAAIRGNQCVASELVYESDIVGEILKAVTQDDGIVIDRSALAVLAKLVVKCASPERLALVHERLLHLLEALFRVQDRGVLDLCCMTVLLLLEKGINTNYLVSSGLIGYLCSLSDVPCSAVGMLNGMLLRDPDCFQDAMNVCTWTADLATNPNLQNLAMRFLGNMSSIPQYGHFIIQHGVSATILGLAGELAYKSKDDFFIFFCHIVILSPSHAASYDTTKSLFQELFDILPDASPYLWRPFLAMLNSCITSKNECYPLIKEIDMKQLSEAVEKTSLPPDLVEFANLVLQRV